MVFLEEEVGKVTILLCWKGPLKDDGARTPFMDVQKRLLLPVAMSVHGPNVDANRFPLDFMHKCAVIEKKK